MHTVTFDDKEYTKASEVAKRFKYTQDYVGQLCRAKKVDARQVGRAWYVNLDSLQEYRKGKYGSDSKSSEKNLNKQENNYLSRVNVEPILNKKVVKILKQTPTELKEVSVRYQPDDESLIPVVEKSPVYKSLHVQPADASKLRVRKSKKKASVFKPEPIPEVSLKGTLSISEYETKDDPETVSATDSAGETVKAGTEDSKENILKVQEKLVNASDNAPTKPKERHLKVRVRGKKVEPVKVHKDNGFIARLSTAPEKTTPIPEKTLQKSHNDRDLSVESRKSTQKDVKRQSSREISVHRLTPASVTAQKQVVHSSQGVSMSFSFSVAVLLALLCSTLIAATHAEVVVSDRTYDSSFVIQMANLSNIFAF